MTNPSKEESIFQIACELSGEALNAYLEQACGDDIELKARLAMLLRRDRDAGSLDDTHELATSTGKLSGIGPYKILQEIGKGGMGLVYMAEQTQPVRRRVALKIVKPGLDTDQVVARFEAERQALAMMDHPNIAKVLDAGATDDGRPYFVMELVKGVPITQYSDEHRLSTRERLELFVTVCRGVQHAHMKGIIHRDLKPSNVLVAEYDNEAMTKIIDFGVAKAIGHELTEKTMYTQFGQIIGTLDYMSPEQAKFNQLDIDVRSDVYALGVLLYELLTGETPIEKKRLQQSGLEEVLRIIREDDPQRPSTRVGSSSTLPATAEKRSTNPGKLAGQLRDDLDWIVIKAMAKERNARYQSAEELASDIDRHLNDRPIHAKRPSLMGRAAKLLRRNKAAAIASLAVMSCVALASAFGLIAYFERSDRVQTEMDLVDSRGKMDAAKVAAERQQWARSVMPDIRRLAAENRGVEAFQLATKVREVLTNDPEFDQLWEEVAITPEMAFDVHPHGSKIEYRQAQDPNGAWYVAGHSPLSGTAFPKGPLRFRLSHGGFMKREFHRVFPDFLRHDRAISLDPLELARDGMTYLGSVKAAEWNYLRTDLNPFHIDRYEVSNREYKEFVDRGGYQNPDFWSDLEFIRGDETLSWEHATSSFTDSTGSPGPSTWANGTFPDGLDDHPVGGISWFEAHAYATSVGKDLPTVDHWRWAADVAPGVIEFVMDKSNFAQRGSSQRGANDGIGRFEVYDLAGNVREWCFNKDQLDRRMSLGGCWRDSEYQFIVPDALSPWDRDPSNGFRCVSYGPGGPEQVSLANSKFKTNPEDYALPQRVPIEPLIRQHDYDRRFPLNAQTLQTEGEVHSHLFRHEIVQLNTSYNDERFKVHLLIPHDRRDSSETVVFFPGAGAFNRQNSVEEFPTQHGGIWSKLEQFLTDGMIVCRPAYKDSLDRIRGIEFMNRFRDPQHRIQARDDWMKVFVDLRRTVDYLVTRDDVNADRLLYFGNSWGAMSGPISLVLEPRFKAGIFTSGGYWKWEKDSFPEIASSHFAPHVKQPVIMINGTREEFIFPLKYSQQVLFGDLPCPLNEHHKLDCGHHVPADKVFEVLRPWLEKVYAAHERADDEVPVNQPSPIE